MKKISFSHFLTIMIIFTAVLSLSSCISVKKAEDSSSKLSDSIEIYNNIQNTEEEGVTIPAPTFKNNISNEYNGSTENYEFSPYDLGSETTLFYYNSSNGAWRIIEIDSADHINSIISVETYMSVDEAKAALDKLSSESNSNYSEIYTKDTYLVTKYSSQSIDAFNNDGKNSLINHIENNNFSLIQNPYTIIGTTKNTEN